LIALVGDRLIGEPRHALKSPWALHGLATLLFDLLTPPEEADRSNTFDVDLLAERLVASTEWLASEAGLGGLRVGYFGASTGHLAVHRLVASQGADSNAHV
jgi:putative phosphoribosyl transferase